MLESKLKEKEVEIDAMLDNLKEIKTGEIDTKTKFKTVM